MRAIRACAKPKLLRSGLAALTAAAVMASSGPSVAHHSFAMFDMDKQATIEGVVREFQWTNPHIWVEMTVREAGKDISYSIEGAAPNILARRGWTRNTLKPGDRISLVMNPLKATVEGRGGSFVRATFSDGRPVGPAPATPAAPAGGQPAAPAR